MSRIFITSGTGYIGFAVARKAKERGHEVIALARSEESAAKLQEHGIKVQRGDLRQAPSYIDAIKNADVVIHTAATSDGQFSKVDAAVVDVVIEALRETNKQFIYTSGIWVLGDTGQKPADEETITNPIKGLSWRTEVEKKVLAAKDQGIKSVVVRPGIVYGGGIQEGIVGHYFKQAEQRGEINTVGNGENRWSLVHIDDVAELYVLAIEKSPAGIVVHAVDENPVKQREVAELIARTAGIPGKVSPIPVEEVRKHLGIFADGLALDQHVEAPVARRVLGWQPKGRKIADELAQNKTFAPTNK